MIAYHYTYGHKLAGIAAEGALIPTGASIPAWERPSLWFSTNPLFEATALKPILRDGKPTKVSFETLASIAGAFRFVRTSTCGLSPWPAARKLVGIRHADAAKMETVGRRLGAIPSEWWASILPIPLNELTLQVWREGAWHPTQLEREVDSRAGEAVLSMTGPRWR